MPDFSTKLDSSNNRQLKQYRDTITALSGTTQFGIPDAFITFTGNTINIDALQYVQARGYILVDDPIVKTSGVNYVLTRDTDGVIVNTPLTGGTGGSDYTVSASFSASTGIIEFTRLSGGTYTVDIGAYSGTTPDLQEVTDVGNETTNEIRAASFTATSGGTGGIQSFVSSSPFTNAKAVMAVGQGIEFGYLSLRHQDNNRTQNIYMRSNPTVSGTSIYYLPDRTGSYTQPILFTDGSTTVSAATTGIVNLSPLGLGGGTDDYTTGATLTDTSLEFTRQSGSTYSVELSGLSSTFVTYTGATNNVNLSGYSITADTIVLLNNQKEVTGNYAVIDSDYNKTIFLEDTLSRTITVNTGKRDGFSTEFINVGTNNYTFVAGTATLNNPDGTILKPNRICTLFKRNSDGEFWLKGELE